jgi:hypothetical protein
MEIKKTDSTHTLLLFKNAYSGMNTQLEIKMVEGLWKVNLLNNP